MCKESYTSQYERFAPLYKKLRDAQGEIDAVLGREKDLLAERTKLIDERDKWRAEALLIPVQ